MHEVLDRLLDDPNVPMSMLEPRTHPAADQVPGHAHDIPQDSLVAGCGVELRPSANRLRFQVLDIAATNVATHLNRPMRKPTQQLVAILRVRKRARRKTTAPQGNHLVAISSNPT